MKAKLNIHQELINKIHGFVTQLEKGEMKLDDVLEYQKLCAELNENAIILKYKAFESSVKGEEIQTVSNIEEERDVITEQPHDEPERIQEIEEFELNFELEEQEIEVNESQDEELEPEIIAEPEVVVVEEPKVETKTEPSPQKKAISFDSNDAVEDNSLANQFEGQKLDTLVGAFGLNQKLRYINDLFDGSSEAFGDTIKMLDNLESLAQAKEKVGEIATDYEWDAEEESVVEFITILKRRYA